MIVFRIEIENRMTVTMFLCDVGIAAHYYIPRGHVQWSLPLSHKKVHNGESDIRILYANWFVVKI